MACKGKIISNPVNHQTIEFITTAKDSNGNELEMVTTWVPHSMRPTSHYHPYQQEHFLVIDGELTVFIDGRTKVLHKGQTIDIPPNTVHAMWNDSDSKTVANWKVSPALNTEYFLETAMGLANDGKIKKNGMPDLLQASLLAQKYRREFRLAKPPYLVQRIVFALLTPFALLTGKKAFYKNYVD